MDMLYPTSIIIAAVLLIVCSYCRSVRDSFVLWSFILFFQLTALVSGGYFLFIE